MDRDQADKGRVDGRDLRRSFGMRFISVDFEMGLKVRGRTSGIIGHRM
jgi:hypothetical protein